MSIETHKPFLAQQNVDSRLVEVRLKPELRQRNCNLLAVILSIVAFLLALTLFGYVTWSSTRLCRLEKEISDLNLAVKDLRKDVGVNFGEDFSKDYSNALIIDNDDSSAVDDLDDDDDVDDASDGDDNDANSEDSEDDDVAEENEQTEDVSNESISDSIRDPDDYDYGGLLNSSDDDNLYDDLRTYLTKRNKSKVESTRKTRSIIAHNSNKLTNTASVASSHAENQSFDTNKWAEEQKSTPLASSTAASASSSEKQSISTERTKNAIYRRHFVAEKFDGRISPLRHRSLRKHKLPQAKSGESLISVKTTTGHLRSRPATPAAHYHLNRKVPERHAPIKVESYTGDMYIGHPSFTDEISEHYFQVENGVLTVRESGLYYIYAQVCYNNTHDQNGFVIFHGHRAFLQCLNTVPTNLPLKIHTCHTSGLIHLHANDTIHLRDFHSDRNVILRDTNNRSYFGIIKI